ncbi:hypothetical protein D3C84_1042890 [compost metagenome]
MDEAGKGEFIRIETEGIRRVLDVRGEVLLCHRKLASDHKRIEHFLPVMCCFGNIHERQFFMNDLFAGLVGFLSDDYQSFRRVCIHAGHRYLPAERQ